MKKLIKIKTSLVLLISIFLFNFGFVNAEVLVPLDAVDEPELERVISLEPVKEESIPVSIAAEIMTPFEVEDLVEEDSLIILLKEAVSIDDEQELVDSVLIENEVSNIIILERISSSSKEVFVTPTPSTGDEDELVALESSASNIDAMYDIVIGSTSTEEVVLVSANEASLISEINISPEDKLLSLSLEEEVNVIFSSSVVEEELPLSFDILTSVVRDSVFQGPKIIALWQMLSVTEEGKYLGRDDSMDSGVQILPSGQFEIDKEIAICTVVANESDVDDLVSAMLNYPKNIAYSTDDYSRGCGVEFDQVNLSKVDKLEANDLICNSLRLNNNSLLNWGEDSDENYTYGYEQLCGYEGFLATQKANLYCATSSLAYDDPAGEYEIEIVAESRGESDFMVNKLKYLELTNYEKDFDDIQYGMVTQNKVKYLHGDLDWNNGDAPTIRNTGNTRLQLKIWQNDFNLGKTNDIWNVSYKARIGRESLYLSYSPEATTTIDNILGLGDIVNIDLAILINNFPENDDQISFFGKMTMLAEKIPELICQL